MPSTKERPAIPKTYPSLSSTGESNIIRIAIFASGAGSNARRITEYFNRDLQAASPARVALIVCNKPGAGVLQVAAEEGIPSLLIERERFFSGDGYLQHLLEAEIDLIVLAGFLWKVPQTILGHFPRRIINIHPALLPKYGGRGMYGQKVHEAVLAAKEKDSGITIHYVDEHYDNGDIILQVSCPVLPGDSPASLAMRVHELEYANYPRAIETLVNELRRSGH